MVAVIGVFWLAGLGLSGYVSTKPCIRVTIRPGAVGSIYWRFDIPGGRTFQLSLYTWQRA